MNLIISFDDEQFKLKTVFWISIMNSIFFFYVHTRSVDNYNFSN